MEKLSKHQIVVLIIAVLALGMGAGLFVGSRLVKPTPDPLPQIIDDLSSAEITPTVPVSIRVYVTGAVLHPDVYTLPAGSILRDALAAAGGAANDADLIAVNLAARLEDGEQVTVPVKSPDGSATVVSPTSPPSNTHARISINRGTLADLDTLPGIGPAKAQAILDYRAQHGPFKRLEDLQNVTGIGTKTYEDLKSLITL
ncbi:MAG: helix-hairpin-helix domain-containing protein [Caldiserica bacterium]|nr:helix-hairpin-helix domain-containing protein [Caldisericota bacterium]